MAKYSKMKPSKLIWTFFVLIFLSNCTPEKRLRHLLDKYPHLQKKDSTVTYVNDTTKGIDENFTILIDTTNSGVDSIFDSYKLVYDEISKANAEIYGNKIDSINAIHEASLKDLKHKLIYYVNNKKQFNDTTIIASDSTVFTIKHENGKFNISANKPPVITARAVSVHDNSVTAKPCEIPIYKNWLLWFVIGVVLTFTAVIYTNRK